MATEERLYYRVDVESPCATCGAGTTWRVVGEDGHVISPGCFKTREDAGEFAHAVNLAHWHATDEAASATEFVRRTGAKFMRACETGNTVEGLVQYQRLKTALALLEAHFA